jgi:hypothetical protein
MFITKKHLSRRTVLRGLGVSVALPLLDSMVPAGTALAETAANPAPHLGFIYFPLGAVMHNWTPKTAGADFEFPKIVKPLEPYRKHITIVSGMGNSAADSSAVHAITPGTWLSGVAPRKTHEPYAGVTIDQIAAQHLGQDTPLPSLEITTEEAYLSGGGSCDRDYGCSYASTISFRTPTTPLPMESDPRKVFQRLFGQGDSAAERKAKTEKYSSILDVISKEAAGLQRTLAADDRARVNDYLDSVREIERRIETLEKQQTAQIDLPETPGGIPEDFDEHLKLMFDLAALAYQAKMTRIVSMMMVREATTRTYPFIGVPEAFHPASHHQNNMAKMERVSIIQAYHSEIFARFLGTLEKTQDGDGSLLDHSVIVYGSNMSNSNQHNHFPLPMALAGRACGKIKGGQHLVCPDHTPVADLLRTVLDRVNVPLEKLGDSTGKLMEI